MLHVIKSATELSRRHASAATPGDSDLLLGLTYSHLRTSSCSCVCSSCQGDLDLQAGLRRSRVPPLCREGGE